MIDDLFVNVSTQGKDKGSEMKEKVVEVLKSKEGRQVLHKQFSSECFNMTWGFIDKKELSGEDVEDMIATSYASLWHWKQREDCKPENLSVAYWQLGRVHCLAKKAMTAKEIGQKCLEVSQKGKLDSFYIGYAYEVLINVAILENKKTEGQKYLELAKAQLELVNDQENKGYLKADLDKLEAMLK